jgi:membrane protease YdiL (CAAX protease family)
MTEPQESLVSNKSPLTSLLLILFIVFIGFLVVGPMIGFMLAMPFYEGDFLTDLIKNQLSSDAFVPLMLLQGATSFIGLVLMPMAYIRYSENRPIREFFPRYNNLPFAVAIACVMIIPFIIALSPITEWNMSFEFPESIKSLEQWLRSKEDSAAEMTKVLTNFNSFGSFLLGLLVIAVFAGIGEEFVFRGLIQNELYRSSKNIHLAIWVSAILFSAFHMQFFGFLPRLFLGALFGYLYYWSGSLWVPVIAHFFNNAFLLTMVYLQSIGLSSVDMEDETSAPLSLVAVCAAAVFALLYFFKRQYSAPQQLS